MWRKLRAARIVKIIIDENLLAVGVSTSCPTESMQSTGGILETQEMRMKSSLITLANARWSFARKTWISRAFLRYAAPTFQALFS
jgi:hypothetical protein